MTLYMDAVWLLNFFIDFMLLMLTKAVIRDQTKNTRLLFGAFVASLLVPISIYFPDSFFTSLIGKFLYSILIVLTAFRFHSVYQMGKLFVLFYFISFAVGGGLIGLHYLTQSTFQLSTNGILTFNGGYGDPVSWLFVIIGFPIISYFTKSRMDKHAVEKIRYDQIYLVKLQLKKETYETTGYIDSGNHLTDPITKKPVVICDEVFLSQWFTKDEWILLKKCYEQLDLEHLPKRWKNNIHIVPYQGVDGNSKFLFTLKPNNITIQYNEKTITTKHVLIGIQFARLTKDAKYHCLLQPQIFKLVA